MQNVIFINRTYSEWTPETAEDGEFSDNGFIAEKEEVTFRELVELMEAHDHPSQSPNDGSTDVWYSTEAYIDDYGTGTERQESIHFHKDNHPHVARYWTWAARAAGRIK